VRTNKKFGFFLLLLRDWNDRCRKEQLTVVTVTVTRFTVKFLIGSSLWLGISFSRGMARFAAKRAFSVDWDDQEAQMKCHGRACLLTDAGKAELTDGRNGVLYENAAGQQNAAGNVATSADTIFRVASMTKPITSVAIMILVDEGRVELEDPVAKYLPEFGQRRVIETFNEADASYTTRRAKGQITFRHLLSHTSGLGHWIFDPIVNRIYAATDQAMPVLALLHHPGAEWTYRVSTRTLSWVVEKVSGQSLDSYFRERGAGGWQQSTAAPAKAGEGGGGLAEDTNGAAQEAPVSGDSGPHSTARDYGRVRTLLNGGALEGGRVLSAGSSYGPFPP
jgi:CubicO group peptidase (beta-lactamase class C family)